MGSISGDYSLTRGAEIDVEIEAPMSGSSCKLRFLIDNGAQMSRIKPSIAQKLSLHVVGDVITNSTTTTNYLTQAWQSIVRIDSLRFTSSPMRVGALVEASTIDGLLGRDILTRMIFCANGPAAQYTLTWDQSADRDPLSTDESYCRS